NGDKKKQYEYGGKRTAAKAPRDEADQNNDNSKAKSCCGKKKRSKTKEANKKFKEDEEDDKSSDKRNGEVTSEPEGKEQKKNKAYKGQDDRHKPDESEKE